jgi:hypothetical protein
MFIEMYDLRDVRGSMHSQRKSNKMQHYISIL